MAALTREQKGFIVERLAMFDTPQQVADAVKEEFKVEITRQGVQFYDPTVGPRPGKEWIARFEATRAAFLTGKASLAITHRAWRQRELEDMARRAKKNRNYKLAAELLEQAAKEDGEMFVNHRAKPAVTESEDERVQRMRSAIMLMDDLSAPPEPAIAPALTIARGIA